MVMLHRTLLALAGSVRWPVLAGAGVGLALFAVRVTQAVLVGAVLAAVLRVPGAPAVTTALIWLCAAVGVRSVLVWARDVVSQDSAERIKMRLRERLLTRLVELGPGHLTHERSGRLQATIVDGVEALEAYYSRYLPQLVVTLVGPPIVIVWMIWVAPPVGLVVLVAALAVPLLPRLWDRLLTERGQEHWAAYGTLGADYLDAMQGMTTLKALDAAGHRRQSLVARARHLLRSTMRQMGISLVDTGLTAVGSQVGVGLAVGIGAVMLARGDLDVAVLVVLLVLATECFRPFQELSGHWHAGFLGVSAAGGITELLQARAASPDRPNAPDMPAPAPGRPAAVTVEAVTVTYPGRDDPALLDVSMEFPAGTTTAVVGPSGAGKTTLVSLLTRSVSPDTGTIRIDGTDIAGVTAESVHRSVAVVSQDTYLFHGTVADNLRLGRPEASDEDLVAACRIAGIHDTIEAMPGGYGSLVGERGLTLSGGQRQRLAIARALLRDAPVLILDEATSALDGATEEQVLDAIGAWRHGRTVVIISHRPSVMRHADRVVELDRGRVTSLAGRP